MRVLDIALTTYGRMIRVPVVGALIAMPIRLVKRLFSDPTRRFWTKLDLAVSASAAMRNDLDGADRRIGELETEVARLKLVVKQQMAVLETVGLQAAAGEAKPERVVVRIDWSDGASREVALPVDSTVRIAHEGARAHNGANGAGGPNGSARNGSARANGGRSKPAGS